MGGPCGIRVRRALRLAIAASALSMFAHDAAHAAVYCKAAGIPKGCVARPAGSVGVGAPGVGVRPGVGVGAPGAGVRAGTAPRRNAVNRGGPVNRVGVR